MVSHSDILKRTCWQAMDQMLVDISHVPSVKPEDVAVIIGQSGDKRITVCDLTEQTVTISNEILRRLGERLEQQLI